MAEEIDYRQLILRFIWTLTLADYLDEAADDIDHVLGILDIDIKWDDLDDLRVKLSEMGIVSLYARTDETKV